MSIRSCAGSPLSFVTVRWLSKGTSSLRSAGTGWSDDTGGREIERRLNALAVFSKICCFGDELIRRIQSKHFAAFLPRLISHNESRCAPISGDHCTRPGGADVLPRRYGRSLYRKVRPFDVQMHRECVEHLRTILCMSCLYVVSQIILMVYQPFCATINPRIDSILEDQRRIRIAGLSASSEDGEASTPLPFPEPSLDVDLRDVPTSCVRLHALVEVSGALEREGGTRAEQCDGDVVTAATPGPLVLRATVIRPIGPAIDYPSYLRSVAELRRLVAHLTAG